MTDARMPVEEVEALAAAEFVRALVESNSRTARSYVMARDGYARWLGRIRQGEIPFIPAEMLSGEPDPVRLAVQTGWSLDELAEPVRRAHMRAARHMSAWQGVHFDERPSAADFFRTSIEQLRIDTVASLDQMVAKGAFVVEACVSAVKNAVDIMEKGPQDRWIVRAMIEHGIPVETIAETISLTVDLWRLRKEEENRGS